MSAPVHVTNSPIQSVSEWRKRPNPNDYSDSSILSKRQRCQYYYILASESSMSEDERSESVDSIQDQETDLCKDTTDTDTKSEQSDDDCDMQVEYEIVSSSEPEENPFADGSSSGENALIAAGAVAATIAKESDVEIWVTDEDDETDSVTSIIESQLLNFQTCKKCKIRKTVSCFPLCSHCYQIRKNCYPPRPRHRKPKSQDSQSNSGSVTAEGLSACLNVLSQDSGLGSSQEVQSSSNQLQTLAWDKVVVPENLIKSSNSTFTMPTTSSPLCSSATLTYDQTMENWKSASNELCIICNASPKNGIFVHSTTGHLCCCYNCAVKFWTKSKRCAWCNLKAKNVIKAFLV